MHKRNFLIFRWYRFQIKWAKQPNVQWNTGSSIFFSIFPASIRVQMNNKNLSYTAIMSCVFYFLLFFPSYTNTSNNQIGAHTTYAVHIYMIWVDFVVVIYVWFDSCYFMNACCITLCIRTLYVSVSVGYSFSVDDIFFLILRSVCISPYSSCACSLVSVLQWRKKPTYTPIFQLDYRTKTRTDNEAYIAILMEWRCAGQALKLFSVHNMCSLFFLFTCHVLLVG